MMELSHKDIKRLVKAGHPFEKFAIKQKNGTQLRNVDGYCIFYNRTENKCQIYDVRPVGCYIYPVIYIENEGTTIDKLCPMGNTIPEKEFRKKTKTLHKLLKTIDNEIITKRF